MEYQFFTSTDHVCEYKTCKKITAPGAKYCSSDHRRKATHNATRDRRRIYEKRFIGVDGEGVTVLKLDGSREHRYVMLSVGDETLWKDGQALTPDECFRFLYDHFERHAVNHNEAEAVYVGFYLGYDFTMMLKDLPERCGRLLFSPVGIASRKPRPEVHKNRALNPTPWPVLWHNWEFDMLGMRRLKLRPEQPVRMPWLYVCDVGSFFQTSFLNVINPAKWPNGDAPCTPEEYELIRQGKTARGLEIAEGDVSYFEDMVKYNRLENEILARVMQRYHSGLVNAGVRLNRETYFGPGQAAQKWLDVQVKQSGRFLSHEQVAEVTPGYAIDAAKKSYYGGRFEVLYHGHVPGITYEYDIVSAYPHIMRRLPCLCGGRWERGTFANDPLSVADKFTYDILFLFTRVRSDNRQLGGLPLRTPKGSIIFPDYTAGWYVAEEVEAADSAGLIDERQDLLWVGFKRSCKHEPPLAMLADMFKERQKVGKAAPYGIALKLILNSLYGKFAQSIGNPKYGNPIYASLITALTRVMILQAIRDLNDVVMIATDGIYLRKPHPQLDQIAADSAGELGSWERAELHNLTIMKPGVYWHDGARKGATLKSRGISQASLKENLNQLDNDFLAFYRAMSQIQGVPATLRRPRTVLGTAGKPPSSWARPAAGEPLPLPTLKIPIPFAVTSPRLAIARGDWTKAGAVAWDETRDDVMVVKPKRTNLTVDGPYLRSDKAAAPSPDVISKPYDRDFGFDTEENSEELGFSQTGVAWEEFVSGLADTRDES